MKRMLGILLAAASLAACDETGESRMATVPSPEPTAPPSPPLPLTTSRALEIMGTLSNTCREVATMKMAQAKCEERQGRTVDHAALRTELRDLAWNMAKLTPDEASKQCEVIMGELSSKPKPQPCWDL
ncbi:hypothetical protein ACIQC9_08000 [Brevundimonas sp. NPDC092305]|uniref:hypothetical protein n=1 Tax=Brevundimonas sp. NPDC092305 TaxID=3363957 RepID=UPI003803CDB1